MAIIEQADMAVPTPGVLTWLARHHQPWRRAVRRLSEPGDGVHVAGLRADRLEVPEPHSVEAFTIDVA